MDGVGPLVAASSSSEPVAPAPVHDVSVTFYVESFDEAWKVVEDALTKAVAPIDSLEIEVMGDYAEVSEASAPISQQRWGGDRLADVAPFQ